MTDYYIYEQEMAGNDFKFTKSLTNFEPVIYTAETKQEAERMFIKEYGINEDDASLYYAVSVASTMRFVCEDCGRPFGHPKIIKESRGEYWGIPCFEDVGVCPHCGSGDFFEVEQEERE